MNRPRQWVIAGVIAGTGIAVLAGRWVEHGRQQDRRAMLDAYCVDCHNDLDRSGGLSFEGLSPDSIPEHAEVFERVVTRDRKRHV